MVRYILLLLVLSACRPVSQQPSMVATDEPKATVLLGPAHAHNDYEHDRPLWDALDHGFRSIEVDIHLRDGELYVAHDSIDIVPNRTLRSLYLEPIHHLIRGGYPLRGDQGPLLLLIDIKTDGEETFARIHQTLLDYEEILTRHGPEERLSGAVSVIISGNRPRHLIAAAHPRLAAYDGRLSDLADVDSILIPLISDRWNSHFEWSGEGPMPDLEYHRLRDIVQQSHLRGREIRFWGTPDRAGSARQAVWDTLIAAGVTLINTDDLIGLESYLSGR